MSTRKPRADAERNRARLLEAARELFTEYGAEVQLADVARRAGVGVGTVYRHFPTRDDLVEAAAQHRFAEILKFAIGCGGLAEYLTHVGEVLAGDRGLSAAIEDARRSTGSEPKGQTLKQLSAAVEALIVQDKAAGRLRKDCSVNDVYMIAGALSATIRAGSGDWRRLLDIVLAGLVQ